MTRPSFARRNVSMSKRTKKNEVTRLIVAASEHSPDMLYATRFFAPDAFIFLKKKGRTTIVLSDLEIDRGRANAQVDEVVSYSEIAKRLPKGEQSPFAEVAVRFLKDRKVRKA